MLGVLATGCGGNFSETEDYAVFGDRGHLRHTYDQRFPEAITALIHDCNDWPLIVSPDTLEIDLAGHCSDADMAEILVSHFDAGDQTDIMAALYTSFMAAADLRVPIGEAFPSSLRQGIEHSVYWSLQEADVPEWLLACSLDGAVSMATDRDLPTWNFCQACNDILGYGGNYCGDDPDSCGAGLSFLCSQVDAEQGWDNYADAHCHPPDLSNMAQLEIDDIRVSWDEWGSAPALKLDLDFAPKMKVAELDIRAESGCHGGIASDVLENYGGRLNLEAWIRVLLAKVVPVGRYDVFLEDFAIDAWVPLWVNRGALGSEAKVQASIGTVSTDRPLDNYSMEQFLIYGGTSIADLEGDIADNFEDSLDPTAADMATFMESVKPSDHKVCSATRRKDPWTSEITDVVLHTGPVTDSCREPDGSIGAHDVPWCMVHEGKLLCIAGIPQNPMPVDPEDFEFDDLVTNYTSVILETLEGLPLPE